MDNDSTCRLEDCSRPIKYKAGKLCNAHYLQWRRGKPFTRPRDRAIGECAFEDCGRVVTARGLCSGHYQQSIKGYELRRLNRGKHALTVRDAEGRKECQLCREWKPESAYRRHKSTSDGFQSRCRECYLREYDSDAARVRRLKRHYGLTEAEYDAMVVAQGDSCAICGTTDRQGKSWHIDHDHACCPGNKSCGKCVRGLLCAICNQGLGHARDDVSILASMIDYLNAHTTLKNPTRTRSAR